MKENSCQRPIIDKNSQSNVSTSRSDETQIFLLILSPIDSKNYSYL